METPFFPLFFPCDNLHNEIDEVLFQAPLPEEPIETSRSVSKTALGLGFVSSIIFTVMCSAWKNLSLVKAVKELEPELTKLTAETTVESIGESTVEFNKPTLITLTTRPPAESPEVTSTSLPESRATCQGVKSAVKLPAAQLPVILPSRSVSKSSVELPTTKSAVQSRRRSLDSVNPPQSTANAGLAQLPPNASSTVESSVAASHESSDDLADNSPILPHDGLRFSIEAPTSRVCGSHIFLKSDDVVLRLSYPDLQEFKILEKRNSDGQFEFLQTNDPLRNFLTSPKTLLTLKETIEKYKLETVDETFKTGSIWTKYSEATNTNINDVFLGGTRSISLKDKVPGLENFKSRITRERSAGKSIPQVKILCQNINGKKFERFSLCFPQHDGFRVFLDDDGKLMEPDHPIRKVFTPEINQRFWEDICNFWMV